MTDHDRRASARFHTLRARVSQLSRFAPAVAAAVLLCWLGSAPPARADGDVLVSARGATDVRVVLTATRGGGRQVETDSDGDGVVSVRPNSGPGAYELEITAGGVTETTSIEVPAVGTLAVTFASEAAAGSRITTETISRVEEITVTGLKHEQALQDVPASIQALTADTLEAMGADDFTDYARNVPALNFADLGPNRVEINLRGMGKLSAGNATVGVYIDDIAVANSFNNPDLKLFDVERVEILRGPQGTLYGEAAMGGAIRLLTNPADPAGLAYKVDATGSSTHGSDGENWSGNAMVNLPMPRDTFALRLVGYMRDEDGWVDNPILGLEDLNHAETEGARASARWFASESTILTLTATAQSVDAGGQPFTTDICDPEFFCFGELEQFTSVPESDEEDLRQAVGNFQHVFSWAELVVIGGWIDREYDRVIDFGLPADFTSDQKIVSGEARLADATSKTTWVGGVYYKKYDEDNVLILQDLPIPGLGIVDFGNFIFFNTEDTSLFGEATRYFNDKWSGTLGVRAFESEKHDPFTQTLDGFPFDESDLSSDESDVLPKLGLAYDATDRLKLYAIASEGYRPGGVNPIITMNPDAPPTFEEDTNESFELGLKSATSSGKLVFNAALFHVDWEDMQISGTPLDSTLGYTTNAGDTHTEGIEAELHARPLNGLDLTLGGALMEAELDDPAEGGAAGNRLPHTVEEEGSLSAQYRFTLTQSIGAFVRGDIQYRGDAFSDVRNRPEDRTDEYTLGNLNFGVEFGRFEVTAFWRNVTDERAELVRFQDGIQVYRNQPETVGLTLRFNG
jgi:outer membrane receptor protein involved in Fe transport